MGASRYNLIPIPISAIIDSIFALLMIATILKSAFNKASWELSRNAFTGVSLIWFLFCFIQIMNNTTGSINIGNWYQGVRSMAVYPLITAILVPLLIKQYKQIQWFLMLWAFLSILGAVKGYWQRNQGFDPYELSWLYNYGGRTHLIRTGIRYFSFFSDAATFGASMGLSLVAFSIAALYCKNNFQKIYYLIAALAGGYGMIISGTRGSLAIPFAGYALFVLISKNWKMILSGVFILVTSFVFLNLTNIGNDNMFIRRMRSAFDTNDASFQARMINRESLSKDMEQLPMGLGIGISQGTVSSNNRFYITASTPPDSWYVTIWTRTGIIGLSVYLCVLAFTIIYGSYLLMFKIKNKELRGIMTGMLCGVFGVMISAYGGDCYTQFPNGILIYTCQTLVLISPYFDKALTKQQEEREIISAMKISESDINEKPTA